MVKEKQDQMGMKKKVCPPTLCTAKLAPAADDGLLLVLVGRSKYCSANFYGWSLFRFTPHSIKGFSCALNLNYVVFFCMLGNCVKPITSQLWNFSWAAILWFEIIVEGQNFCYTFILLYHHTKAWTFMLFVWFYAICMQLRSFQI